MTPLLVLADTHALARHYADTHHLGDEHTGRWRFIRHPDQVYGYEGPGQYVVVVGRKPIPAVARKQRGDTIAALKQAGFRRIDP